MNYIKTLIPVSIKKNMKKWFSNQSVKSPRDMILQSLPSQSIGAEIGVHEGDFAAYLLEKLNPVKLHLIDPWEYQEQPLYGNSWYGGNTMDQTKLDQRYQNILKKFHPEILREQVVVHRAYSNEVAGQFKDAYFDWVYIDGNHLYEYVREDLQHYYSKLKSGGYLLGDDYNLVGWWEDGVTRAVDEFAKEHNLELQVIGRQFLLQKP